MIPIPITILIAVFLSIIIILFRILHREIEIIVPAIRVVPIV